MKVDLVVESDGNGGLFAYLDGTPIVTAGDDVDEIMTNVLLELDKYNNANPDEDVIEIGELVFSCGDE